MLNQDAIKEHLSEWMINFLERPNPNLGNWSPCPYSRQARISNKIEIVFVDSTNLLSIVNDSKKLLKEKDVVIIAFDHTQLDHTKLTEFVRATNSQLIKDNFILLRDHPDESEYINDVKMNFGYCGLLILQKLSELKEASDNLLSKGYYDTWDKQIYHNMTSWRTS
jgi:hypothetical protein